MIRAVLFDMGGTLEDIWYSDETAAAVTQAIMQLLRARGLHIELSAQAFWARLQAGVNRYKEWSEGLELEKKPEEIWPDYYLADFGFPRQEIAAMAEQLAGTWEVVYYHRQLRADVKDTLQALRDRGYTLGVISNTASLFSVYNLLEQYEIRSFFDDVTLSSVTGYRKPHRTIFEIACRQLQETPDACVYVGDTLSRDVIGAKRAGFGAVVQIRSQLSAEKDADVRAQWEPDYVIRNISDVIAYLDHKGQSTRMYL